LGGKWLAQHSFNANGMIDSLSLLSPAPAAGPAKAGNASVLEPASFPGIAVFGGVAGQPPEQRGALTRRPVGGAAPGGLASGATLLSAQQAPSGGSGGAKSPGDLSEEEQKVVAELKQIDAKVRAHERAHAAVGGAHAGAPSYSYTRGPDGQMYATGGEVAIDIGAENDPEATLQKAEQVAAAALAPADPSGADRAVAAAAAALRQQALAQIRAEKRAEREAEAGEDAGDGGAGAAEAGTGPAGRAAQAYQAAVGNALAQASRGLGQLVGLTA
jgi:hypothetical protein